MATTEHDGLLTYVDENGNKYLLYPITKVDNVDGLEEELNKKAPASHTAAVDNPHNVTAAQVGATPASHATATNNPHGVTIAQIGAAPAGYGLGGEVRKAAHCDECTESGFWSAHSGFPDGVDGSTHLGIAYRFNGWIYQELRRLGTDATYKLIRKKNEETGAWQPWEWENPPMEVGKEYRTTERWNGKAVYTQIVEFGNLPNASSKSVVTAVGYDHLVSISGILYASGGVTEADLFANNDVAHWVDKYTLSSGEKAMLIGLTTHNDISSATARVIVKYTKA